MNHRQPLDTSSTSPLQFHRHHDPAAEYLVPPVVLKVEGLVKNYGPRRVVDGVSFHVNRGEIVGLLGPNGAGKTTSFRITCGLLESNAGVVFLNGQDVTGWPMYRRSRDGGMGYLPQDRSVFGSLTAQNNLLGVMEMLGMDSKTRKNRCEELLEKFSLTHVRHNVAGRLSGGERRRLEVARALVSDPKIILLDEPFAAIDPVTVAGIQGIILRLSQEGISFLITDHNVHETLQITQRSYVIESGRVLCHGTPDVVLANPEAREKYFGQDVSFGGGLTTAVVPRVEPVDRSLLEKDKQIAREKTERDTHEKFPAERETSEKSHLEKDKDRRIFRIHSGADTAVSNTAVGDVSTEPAVTEGRMTLPKRPILTPLSRPLTPSSPEER